MLSSCCTLASQTGPVVAVQLLVLLATAAVVATILGRLKLESIPGYLIAGALVGPHVLGLVGESEAIEQISQLAIILLMFGIGLHLDIASIRRGMIHIVTVGIVSTALFSAIGWGVLVFAGVRPPAALVLAMALAMSSTAVLVRTLMARRESRATYGRVTLGVAIVQDLLTVVVMAALPPIAQWAGAAVMGSEVVGSGAEASGWVDLVVKGAIAVGSVAAMLVLGRLLLPRLLHEVSKVGSGELVLVVSAAIALGAAITTGLVGLSPEMGAFLAGLLLALTPFRYQLSGQMAPMRDLLMAIFFTVVGLNFRPSLLVEDWWIIGLSLVGVVAIKTLLIAATAWMAGMSAPSALIAGTYLGNAGEFTLIVLGAAGGAMGIVTDRQEGDAIAVVIASLIISPLLVGPVHHLAARVTGLPTSPFGKSAALRERTQRTQVEAASPPRPEDQGEVVPAEASPDGSTQVQRHVIIAGFGPVGRSIADRFEVAGIPYVVIELNTTTVERQSARGRRIVYGDVTNSEVLESAGVHRADAVILTFPDDEAMLRACEAVRAMAPTAFIAARTSFLSGSFRAQQLGADHVTVEEIATAQAMEKEVLAKLKSRYSATVEA